MPQLVPFSFINQVSFGYLLLLATIYLFSTYILPTFLLVVKARLILYNPTTK